ncbi:MAG: ERCC4 domain-containing protein [Candidatus Aenigmatarchaeota archaeon]
MKKIVIYIDHREATGILDILKDYENVKIIEKQLRVGDYLLSKRVAVERKVTNDFLQSMTNGRLFKQLKNLKQSYSKPLLIIEGEESVFESKNIHPNAIAGALASITITNSIPILWTHNQKETASLLYTIAKREQQELKKDVKIREKISFPSSNRQQEYIVSGLPNISTTLAKRLLNHFKTPSAVFTASKEDLQKIEGIGKDKAEAIRKVLSRIYEKSILD